MLLLGSAPAFAQNVTDGGRTEVRQQMMDQKFDQLVSKLGLDAAGAARLKSTFEKYRSQLMPLRKAQWDTRKQIQAELASQTPDQAKLRVLTDQLTANRQQMESLEQQRTADLKSQLTAQQFAQLVVARQHHGRWNHHMRNGEKQ
jgi:Spy/CpxP family protein refolding chaperone